MADWALNAREKRLVGVIKTFPQDTWLSRANMAAALGVFRLNAVDAIVLEGLTAKGVIVARFDRGAKYQHKQWLYQLVLVQHGE